MQSFAEMHQRDHQGVHQQVYKEGRSYKRTQSLTISQIFLLDKAVREFSWVPAEILLEHAVVERVQMLAHNPVLLQLRLVLLHRRLHNPSVNQSIDQSINQPVLIHLGHNSGLRILSPHPEMLLQIDRTKFLRLKIEHATVKHFLMHIHAKINRFQSIYLWFVTLFPIRYRI